ncbi:flavin reductase [Carboxylicivirga marina]|uniref:Nitroreductase family protein n=1 Tax=Carboxylicivirga marina TaxID=2800988 RepID=A0ABS1HIE6_9BACT|nr:flavin reductase [Carboxylicivirga marina]MBK3517342.1 nitroreductase family protein [Carboxylicivirga marina]
MRNKASLLNVLLATVVVVLVYQLVTQERAPKTETIQSQTVTNIPDSIPSKMVSVGPKGHIHPKPAVVVGSYSTEGEPNIMTAAWAGVVNSTPMSIGVSIRPSRKSYDNIIATKAFTVNVPSPQFVAHMDYAGNVSGYDDDKFKTMGLTPVKGDFVNAPYIGEFPIAIECEVTDMIDLGSHVQFIGKVIDTKVDSKYLKANNEVDIERINPIIFGGDYYYGFGQRLGQPWDIGKLFKEGEAPTYQPLAHENPTLASIYNRKSVRHYTDQKVSREQLRELVKAGMAAPTAANRQPWAFVAISDRSILDSLSGISPYTKMLKEATAAIVVFGDMNKALEGKGQPYWIQDCSAASQNILLAAESMGLGAVWTGVHPIKEREEVVRRVLNAPENVIPLNVIVVGYPTGEDKPKDKWVESNVHWEKW